MSTTPFAATEQRVDRRAWPPPQGEWAYEHWLQLPDDGYRYEVIDGELFVSPPPRTRHQQISIKIVDQLLAFLRLEPQGRVLYAPVGVHLPNQPVPFQPDILYIRSERVYIIQADYVEGSPDVVVEILSPSNWLYDRREKMRVYREARVPEYWIVDPRAQSVEVYVLEGDEYLLTGEYGVGEKAPSRVLSGFELAVKDVFAD